MLFSTIGRKVTFVILIVIFIIWYWWPASERNNSESTWKMYPRVWTDVAEKTISKQSFTVLSYNILVDKVLGPMSKKYASKTVLNKHYRHSHVMVEMGTLKPDVVHMQEVQQPHYKKTLAPDMSRLGYDGVILIDDKFRQFGQATFWKRKNFKLIEHYTHPYHDQILPYIQRNSLLTIKEKTEVTAWLKAVQNTNGFIVVHLQDTSTGNKFIFGNTHLTWDGLRCPSLPTLQAGVVLQYLSDLSKKTGTKAIVFTGDLNTPPTYPAYDFIERGRLDQSIRNNIISKTAEMYKNHYAMKLPDLLPECYRHDLLLQSAYKKAQGKEPELTNADHTLVVDRKDVLYPMCLDYIWYSNLTLTVSRVLQLPDKNSVLKYVGIPSVLFPSDHLPMMAEFYI